MGKKEKNSVMLLDEVGVMALKKEMAPKEEDLLKLKQKNREKYSHSELDNWNTPKFSEGAEERILRYEINRLKNILNTADILKSSVVKEDDLVDLNDVIEVYLSYGEDDEERMILRLGTVHQTKTEDGIEIISIESQLGEALYKSKVGSSVRFGDRGAFRADILSKINQKEKEDEIAVEKVKK